MKNAPLSVNWTGSGAFYVSSLFLLWHLIFLSAAFTLLDDGIFHIVPEKNVTILRNDPSKTEIKQTVQLRKAIPSDVRKMDV